MVARILLAAAVFLLAARPVRANEFARTPLSARQQGSGALYGSYDLLKSFQNPALLSGQPRSWEFGCSNQLMFGADQDIFALAGGWMGQPGETGTFGGALLVSGLTAKSFAVTDAFGNATGETVSPASYTVSPVVAYQWNFLGVGAGVRYISTSLGVPDGSDSRMVATIGAAVTLGRLDVGLVYRLGDATWLSGLGFGAAFRWSSGSVGLDVDWPAKVNTSYDSNNSGSGGGYPVTVGVGLDWTIHPLATVRTGLVLTGEKALAPRVGFTVPWKNLAIDYALVFPVGDDAGLGVSNMLAIRYVAGRDRKPAEKPRFFMKEAERTLAVGAFESQNVSAGDAGVIADMFRNEIIREGSFNVVEKVSMDKILQEQAFQQTGCTTAECAVKLGKILNVKYLVLGSFGKLLDLYVTSIRVVDVETAKAVYSDSLQVKDSAEVPGAVHTLAGRLTAAVKQAK